MSFCQICRCPTPDHEPDCPVLTGAPQEAMSEPFWMQDIRIAVRKLEAQRALVYSCPHCGRVSYNPEDVRARYCGACYRYEER